MQSETPPTRSPRMSTLADRDKYSDAEIDSLGDTPVSREYGSMAHKASNHEDSIAIFHRPGGIPATPRTTLEPNDGSQLRTPFGNYVSWNGHSPDIISPNDIHNQAGIRQIFPQPGQNIVTPQYITILPPFGRVDESPLAAKSRLSQAQNASITNGHHNGRLSRSASPEQGPVRPLFLDTPVVSTTSPAAALVKPQSLKDDATLPIAPGDFLAQAASTMGSAGVTKERVAHCELPETIRRWCEAPSPPTRLRTFDERRKKQETIRACITASLHARQNAVATRIVQGRLYPVVEPEELDALGLESSTSIPYKATYDVRRLQSLKTMAAWLERSDSETEDEDEDRPKVGDKDPGNAFHVLHTTKSVRTWLATREDRRSAEPQEERETTPPAALELDLDKVMEERVEPEPEASQKAPKIEEGEKDDKHSRGETPDGEDDGENCICRGAVKSNSWVQCEACETWHHVACVTTTGLTKDLPKHWFCWRCPARSVPEEEEESGPSFTMLSSPVKKRATASDVPLYLAPSPRKKSHSQPQPDSFTLFEPGNAGSFDKATPSPLRGGYSTRGYGWPGSAESSRMPHDRLDDPMAAIASTPLSSTPFVHAFSAYSNPNMNSFLDSPAQSLGLRFAPYYNPYPKKERPWTNYTGSFAISDPAVEAQPPVSSSQSMPTVDPLFIHYEHDAPKQTAHHQVVVPKPKKKMRTRSMRNKEKNEQDEEAAPGDEVGEGSGTNDASVTNSSARGSVPPESTNPDASVTDSLSDPSQVAEVQTQNPHEETMDI